MLKAFLKFWLHTDINVWYSVFKTECKKDTFVMLSIVCNNLERENLLRFYNHPPVALGKTLITASPTGWSNEKQPSVRWDILNSLKKEKQNKYLTFFSVLPVLYPEASALLEAD